MWFYSGVPVGWGVRGHASRHAHTHMHASGEAESAFRKSNLGIRKSNLPTDNPTTDMTDRHEKPTLHIGTACRL